jgi:hypothetical protein
MSLEVAKTSASSSPSSTSAPAAAGNSAASAISAGVSAPATSAPATSGEGASATPAATTEGAPAEGTADPALASAGYTPNFKFKVDREEKEIPEFLRGIVKDADSEKMVRELCERSEGMLPIKGRLQETRQQLQTVTQQYQGVIADLNQLGSHLKKKDFDTFFQELEVPLPDVVKWVVEKVKFSQLPPEEQDRILASRNTERRAEELEGSYQNAQTEAVNNAIKARSLEIKLVLARPDVQTFADAFDTKFGQPGAFEKALREKGSQFYRENQRDLPPEEAAKAVMEHYGRFIQAQSPAPVLAAPAAGATSASAARTEPPVIPAVPGGTTSPTKQVPRNLDDLKKLANQAAARSSAAMA